MNFKNWLIFVENTDGLEHYLSQIKNHIKPNELELTETIDSLSEEKKQIIKNILVEKKKLDQNHIKYCLGFYKSKPNFLEEDLKIAIETLFWVIRSNRFSKKEIDREGWYNFGKKSQDMTKEMNASSTSKRSLKREKKEKSAKEELKLIAKKGELKMYYSPKVDENDRRAVEKRHSLLCKYGAGTSWCTASPTGTAHENYTNYNIYIIHRNDKPLYQFTDPYKQFMDTEDNPKRIIEEDVMIFLHELNSNSIEDYGLIWETIPAKNEKEFNDFILKNNIYDGDFKLMVNLPSLGLSNKTFEEIIDYMISNYNSEIKSLNLSSEKPIKENKIETFENIVKLTMIKLMEKDDIEKFKILWEKLKNIDSDQAQSYREVKRNVKEALLRKSFKIAKFIVLDKDLPISVYAIEKNSNLENWNDYINTYIRI